MRNVVRRVDKKNGNWKLRWKRLKGISGCTFGLMISMAGAVPQTFSKARSGLELTTHATAHQPRGAGVAGLALNQLCQIQPRQSVKFASLLVCLRAQINVTLACLQAWARGSSFRPQGPSLYPASGRLLRIDTSAPISRGCLRLLR